MTPSEFADMLESVPSRIRTADYRRPLKAVAREVGHSVEGNFARQESSEGVQWDEHAPLTIKLHGPHPLLRLSYAMFNASTNPDDPNAKLDVSNNEMAFGVDEAALPYARKQNAGAGRIPAREFFYVRDSEQPRLEDAFRGETDRIIENEVLQ